MISMISNNFEILFTRESTGKTAFRAIGRQRTNSIQFLTLYSSPSHIITALQNYTDVLARSSVLVDAQFAVFKENC